MYINGTVCYSFICVLMLLCFATCTCTCIHAIFFGMYMLLFQLCCLAKHLMDDRSQYQCSTLYITKARQRNYTTTQPKGKVTQHNLPITASHFSKKCVYMYMYVSPYVHTCFFGQRAQFLNVHAHCIALVQYIWLRPDVSAIVLWSVGDYFPY